MQPSAAVAAMQPETLARVWDAIDRMVHNKLGLHLVRSCKIGNLCYMLEKGGENAVHDKAGRQLREKLLESCNDGQPIRLTDGIGQSGDGYIAMALVLAGALLPFLSWHAAMVVATFWCVRVCICVVVGVHACVSTCSVYTDYSV